MSDPQGLVYWGGVGDLVSAQMTLSPGISPSTCTLVIPPQDVGKIFQSGPLMFEYGARSWTFQRCRMDSIADTVAANGQFTWTLTILDRRCWWQECGRVSGFYNARIGDRMRPGTEKTPHELAELCLDEMGESKYSLAGLPDDARPEIDWDYTNPAEALAQLCDRLGCMVALGLDDRVYIVRKNRGEGLPGRNAIEGSALTDPPDPPGKVVATGNRTRWQVDFELEPIGLDKDGSIVVIDDLTYAPEGGWEEFADLVNFTGLPEEHEKCAGMAQRSVYRWYRIKMPVTLPETNDTVEELSRILPLENEQIEFWTRVIDGVDVEQARPPWIHGLFDPGLAGFKALLEEDGEEPNISNRPDGLYQQGFTLDTETGIVRFNEQVYLTKDDKVLPAEIKLRVACNLRDEETGGWIREEFERSPPAKSPNPGTKAYVVHDDIVREIYTQFDPGPETIVDNLKEVEKKADHYLDAAMIAYTPKQSASISYPGLLPIVPDGAIRQVTWVVASNGEAITRASRNREESAIAQTYDEKRFLERLRKEQRENAKPEQQKAKDREKRKAPK